MSITTSILRAYSLSEFVNAGPSGANFNEEIFQQEVINLALVPSPSVSQQQNGIVQVTWNALPVDTNAAIAAINATVIAHVGGATSSEPLNVFSVNNVDAIDGTAVLVLQATTGLLKKGDYHVDVGAMFRMVTTVANARAVISLFVNGSLRHFEEWPFAEHGSFGLGFSIARNAGQTLSIELRIARVGGAFGTARALGIVPTGTAPACFISIDQTSGD